MSTQDTTLPPLDSTIAGALFDLMGWLTSHETRWVFSSSDHAGAAVEALEQWVKAKGFSIADADVTGWRAAIAAQAQQPLESIEQYRLQMAGISTAAIGYWKEGDGIHPDYDTLALRDVAKLYAKYDALYKAQQAQGVPAHVFAAINAAATAVYLDDTSDFAGALWMVIQALAPELYKAMQDDPHAGYQSLPDLCAPQAEPQAQPEVLSGGMVLVPRELLKEAAESVDDYRAGVEFGSCDRKLLGKLKAAAQLPDAATQAPAPQAEPVHPDDLAVDRFAARMKWKLAQKRNQGRSGWQDRAWTPEMISQALREHVEKGDPLDVANYCMFLAARNEPITQAEPQPEREPTTWSRYVAGMIACYLKWPDDDERVEAVAGIIERRRWSDRRPEREPLSPWQRTAGFGGSGLNDCSPQIDVWHAACAWTEQAHGIGTKGGDK